MKQKYILCAALLGLSMGVVPVQLAEAKATPQRTSYFSSYLGNRNIRIPFVMDMSNKDVGYYRASYLAIKIDEVKVDGKILESSGEVFLDDFDAYAMNFSADEHIFIVNSMSLKTVSQYESNDVRVIKFKLPQSFKKAEIQYRVRTTKGLSDQVNILQLETDQPKDRIWNVQSGRAEGGSGSEEINP